MNETTDQERKNEELEALLAIAFFATPLGDFYADPFKSKPVGETK